MDQVVAQPTITSPTDLPSPTQHHRQSLLGSFLRVRPRGSSQSQQHPPSLSVVTQLDSHNLNDRTQMNPFASSNQPPSPVPGTNNGHRRRPAANTLMQPSVSNGISTSPVMSVNIHGFTQMLRRRRSANGELTAAPAPAVDPALSSRTGNNNAPSHRIRLVPHLDSNRSLHFDPIARDVHEGDSPLRIGRFTDRSGGPTPSSQNSNKIAFRSKVVSRAHAEIWCEGGGKFFIKDTKSSSGTFLNHMRLSHSNVDSKPFAIKDGDVLQLGVDYQGGTEDIYKCVKMRIEIGREWQSQANAFNTKAMEQLKALSALPSGGRTAAMTKSGIADCCICLFSVTVHQSLFIAPCSHVFHYKCIRPLLSAHHPGFCCPLCRSFANLDEDVEIEVEGNDDIDESGSGGSGIEGAASPSPERDGLMDTDAIINVNSMVNATNEVAAHINAGAETEVENEVTSRNNRRRAGDGTLRIGQLPTPVYGQGQMGELLEHTAEELEYPPMLDTEDCGELGAFASPMEAPEVPGAGASTSHRLGFDVVRPMSDDGSDEGGDSAMAGFDGDASGSSGEGPGAGGKRKR